MFSDNELKDLNEAQFVFRIAESDYHITFDNYGDHIYSYYRLEDSGVLRLHFATSSGVYNIGAVSDLVGTDGISDSKDDNNNEEWWQKIMAALMFIIICVVILVLWGPVKLLLGLLWTGLKFLFLIVLWVIKLPFKIIGWLLKAR